jgi:hypothetical protein
MPQRHPHSWNPPPKPTRDPLPCVAERPAQRNRHGSGSCCAASEKRLKSFTRLPSPTCSSSSEIPNDHENTDNPKTENV